LIILDSSGLVALINADEPEHADARAALEVAIPPRLLSPLVLAETDHLLARDLHLDARMAALDALGGPAFKLTQITAEDLGVARDVMRAFRDLDVGLTDASLVALAHRERATDILTLDERHFRMLPGPGGEPFRLLPADA
jgi:uncharacterized protein